VCYDNSTVLAGSPAAPTVVHPHTYVCSQLYGHLPVNNARSQGVSHLCPPVAAVFCRRQRSAASSRRCASPAFAMKEIIRYLRCRPMCMHSAQTHECARRTLCQHRRTAMLVKTSLPNLRHRAACAAAGSTCTACRRRAWQRPTATACTSAARRPWPRQPARPGRAARPAARPGHLPRAGGGALMAVGT